MVAATIPTLALVVANALIAQSEEAADSTLNYETCSGANKEKLKLAMQEEINVLKTNGTWNLTVAPEEKTITGCKWVYKSKRDCEGNVFRHKARLVAQGYKQKYGHDYDEVFAPVAKPATLRMLLTIARKRKMAVRHYDIQSAYLNGDLFHDVYMKQLPGFQEGDEVCKLVKNLHELKQGANEWNRKLNEILSSKRFERSQYEPCLYTMQDKGWI
ncbi:Retrovirus-related Pol polyprotein from transposon TNT 1-94, partial [Stegodyphus mimosarum]